jgi:phosphate/sulfate permease
MDMYLILVLILAILAAIDLTVGVSNDAVNFLNSAQGSKVASMRTILIVASLGVVLGTLSSSGMMEVARKGVFDPAFFTFTDVMWIFLAVMFTDVLLLDFFNGKGLPTSTTVSLVFGLLGAGTVVAVLVSVSRGIGWEGVYEVMKYDEATKIVSSIFSSVMISFLGGLLVQWAWRLAFTFQWEKTLRLFGGVFSGLVGTFIVHFLLVKGAEGSSLLNAVQLAWLHENEWLINGVVFVVLTSAAQLLVWFTSQNPLRYVVLLGTFSLAMAFAGNDLVNFIGVGVGGWLAYNQLTASGMDPSAFYMGGLAERVQTPTYILLACGVIMIITLWKSAKARKVSETEINLSSQEEGSESFASNSLSRGIVGLTLAISRSLSFVNSDAVRSFVEKRFDRTPAAEGHAFDLIRASVNLLVASVLIAYATSLRLPLSTTYVTFMVAMGSSLADRAWGRDTAVYRISGVLTVIGGWVVTAFAAFSVAAALALLMFYGTIWMTVALFVLTLVVLWRSHVSFAKERSSASEFDQAYADAETSAVVKSAQSIAEEALKGVRKSVTVSSRALMGQNSDIVIRLHKNNKGLLESRDKLALRMAKSVRKMGPNRTEWGVHYFSIYDLTLDMERSSANFVDAIRYHLSNHHSAPHRVFLEGLMELSKSFSHYLDAVEDVMNDKKSLEHLFSEKRTILAEIQKHLSQQVALIQKQEVGGRVGMLQAQLLLEMRDVVAVSFRLSKALSQIKSVPQ